MGPIIIICTPFLLAGFALFLVLLRYDRQWKRNNPWWKQPDVQVHLSSAEHDYRPKERRRYINVILCWCISVFLVLGLMLMTIFAYLNGGLDKIGHNWIYLLPIAGLILLCINSIQQPE